MVSIGPCVFKKTVGETVFLYLPWGDRVRKRLYTMRLPVQEKVQ